MANEGLSGELEPSDWDFSQASFDLDDDLVAIGADLKPGTLWEAYRSGVFPMGLGEGGAGPVGWWSPQERGVLRRGALRISNSLRKSRKRFAVSVDADFSAVVAACADPARSGAWITAEIQAAYEELHRLGIAHSIEVWRGAELVGGLYGVSIGGLFAGESMFHRASDASKVALCSLVEIIYADASARLIDVQWATEHLSSLGVEQMSRQNYLACLVELREADPIRWPLAGSMISDNPSINGGR